MLLSFCCGLASQPTRKPVAAFDYLPGRSCTAARFLSLSHTLAPQSPTQLTLVQSPFPQSYSRARHIARQADLIPVRGSLPACRLYYFTTLARFPLPSPTCLPCLDAVFDVSILVFFVVAVIVDAYTTTLVHNSSSPVHTGGFQLVGQLGSRARLRLPIASRYLSSQPPTTRVTSSTTPSRVPSLGGQQQHQCSTTLTS